ncbi:alpha-galactosidase [Parageobacillus sp. VR-IP]|uniref:Sip1-related alpha-galactosidase n=1 Tax=Parageobacillus sp. VR-IP TaxID=2742205 RepID=UPI001582FB41|nr:Sip1-related alpha-galactosidase [Parageobacillus sp. VR-IP]NUK30251.1 alpha-galactosidase [Parageobacillus sp. VR-IP]
MVQQMGEGDRLHLVNIVKDIIRRSQVWVTFHDGFCAQLKHDNSMETIDRDRFGNYTAIKHFLENREKGVNLSLYFKIYDDMVFTYVDAYIQNERLQNRHTYFAPEKCIILKVHSLGPIEGMLAHYQHKDWWTRPYFSKDFSSLPDRTQSLLWKTPKNYYYLLPVCSDIYKTELSGNGKGFDIKLSSYVGGVDRCCTLSFVLGIGNNPFTLSKKVIDSSIEVLGFRTLPRSKKRYPEILEYLGWCSWDAFYHQVNEKGIVRKMAELKEKKVPVKWVIIDDGWLDVKEDRLYSFNADKEKFPNGLSSTINILKNQFGVNWVGVWHTIAGYWGGIHPESPLVNELRNFLYQTNSNKFVPYPDSVKGFGFWSAWHEILKKQGVDFVKVDSQSAINNFMMYQKSIGEAARGTHVALEASVGLYFDHCIINCMGMASENIWNRPVSAVSRNSDDFVPSKEISFKEHALQNVYNSFYHGQFYWGDWDMFWTNHEEDIQNAVLRAISGGPVYFSDRVGETDPLIVWPLILKDGRILRADQPGLPTEDCLFVNVNEEKVPLKVWNRVNENGIIVAFNINVRGERVKGVVSPSDVPGLIGQKFIVFDYFNQQVNILNATQKLDLVLEEEDVALFIICPLDGEIIPLGLLNKYLTTKTILEKIIMDKKMIVRLAEGGQFGFVAFREPKIAAVNGQQALISRQGEALFTIDCSDQEGEVWIELIYE